MRKSKPVERYLIPYENVVLRSWDGSRAQILQQASEIVDHGWLYGEKYPALDITGKIDWSAKDVAHRSWDFNIHCLDMLGPILKAGSITSSDRYLDLALSIGIDWCLKHPIQSDDNSRSKFAWYGMAVGVRAYRLAYILDAAEIYGVGSSQDREIIWKGLLEHQFFLGNDDNIIFHNNHGFYQAVGQLAMARRFGDRSEEMRQAYDQGIARFKTMIRQQFCGDGVHREHSPAYNRMVYSTLKNLLEDGLIDNDEISQLAFNIELALTWFVAPNMKLGQFGDTEAEYLGASKNALSSIYLTPSMIRTLDENGHPLHFLNRTKIFRESGYFINRKSIDMETKNDSYFVMNAAFHSRTHKHADDLSICWCEYGDEILVDAGHYGYAGKTEIGSDLWEDGFWYSDKNRVYCESTRAHNTLEFDGLNNPRKGVKPYGSAIVRAGEYPNDVVAVETEIKLFKSIRFSRTVLLKPAHWMLILDWYHDNNKEAHTVKQWYHLPAEHDVMVVDEHCVFAKLKSSGKSLSIINLNRESVASEVFNGSEEPQLQGWRSQKVNEIEPINSFCFEQTERYTGCVPTLFTFSSEVTIDPRTEFAVSGRSARVFWSDTNGSHSLLTKRPAEGEFQVDYGSVELSSD